MRGRKPKLRVVGGNGCRRPRNEAKSAPEARIPQPPFELSKEAMAEWDRLSEPLHRAGLLTELNRAVFAAYCDAYAQALQAGRVLRRMAKTDPVTGGLVIRTKKGYPIQNPILGIANKAWAETVRYAIELGMTPRARTRVQNRKSNRPIGPRAEILLTPSPAGLRSPPSAVPT